MRFSNLTTGFGQPISFWLLITTLTVASWVQTAQASEPVNRLAGLMSFNMPQFPKDLVGVKAGDAEVVMAITIDDQGNVSDQVVLEATSESVAIASLNAVEDWKFLATPKTELSPETPWPRREVLQFTFKRSGVVTSLSHAEAAKDGFVSTRQPEVRTVQWQALENKPQPINLTLSGLPDSLPYTPNKPLMVHFVIDRQGAVRVPVITGLDNLEIARLVLSDISHWRYTAPLQHKTPVSVEVTKTLVLPVSKSH
jgi:hypothetical protein